MPFGDVGETSGSRLSWKEVNPKAGRGDLKAVLVPRHFLPSFTCPSKGSAHTSVLLFDLRVWGQAAVD